MRPVLFLLSFIPLFSSAQKLALIDRNFYEPITMVDTMTSAAATEGGLAVYQKDIPMVIERLEQLTKDLGSNRLAPQTHNITLGNSSCIVITEKKGNQYIHHIMFNTTSENIKTSILLVDREANKRTLQRLTIFIDYLKNNISALRNNL
jgi:hypothetical protein